MLPYAPYIMHKKYMYGTAQLQGNIYVYACYS